MKWKKKNPPVWKLWYILLGISMGIDYGLLPFTDIETDCEQFSGLCAKAGTWMLVRQGLIL